MRYAPSVRGIAMILVSCVCGCADNPTPSALNFTKIGFTEEQTPTPLAMFLETRGESPVSMDNVTFLLEDHLALTPAMYSPIKSLTMNTVPLEEEPNADGSFSQLAAGEEITIKPGESRVVK